MTELPVGAYEQIVTDGLHRQLGRLEPDLVERIRLDPADADEVLARHVAALTRRALRAVPGQAARVRPAAGTSVSPPGRRRSSRR